MQFISDVSLRGPRYSIPCIKHINFVRPVVPLFKLTVIPRQKHWETFASDFSFVFSNNKDARWYHFRITGLLWEVRINRSLYFYVQTGLWLNVSFPEFGEWLIFELSYGRSIWLIKFVIYLPQLYARLFDMYDIMLHICWKQICPQCYGKYSGTV